MGRPTKCTPERTMRITKATRAGAPLEVAARFAGITPQTLRNWIRRGRADQQADRSSPYSRFVEVYDTALGEVGVFALGVIVGAAQNGTWQAAAWLLERRFPEHFGRGVDKAAAIMVEQHRVDLDTPEREISALTDDQALLEAIKDANQAA